MVVAVGKARLWVADLAPLYSVWSAPLTVTVLALEKPCAVEVVTVTVATLLALPGVRVMELTVRVGIPVAVMVPVAGEAGTIVVVPVTVVIDARVTLKQNLVAPPQAVVPTLKLAGVISRRALPVPVI